MLSKLKEKLSPLERLKMEIEYAKLRDLYTHTEQKEIEKEMEEDG